MFKRIVPIICIGLYVLIGVTFLRGVLFSPGVLMGGDWSIPFTKIQMERFFHNGFYTWSDLDLFGHEQYFLNGLPFQILLGGLAKLNITGEIYSKSLLFISFLFPASTMYMLCKFLKCGNLSAFIGGYFYMTLPFFFNFAAMGWIFVLLSMGILPLALIAFIESVRKRSIAFALLTGMLFTFAMIQSQSIIWYPFVFISFFPYLIRDKKDAIAYIRSLFIVFFVLAVLNAYWLLPLFLSDANKALSTDLGASTVSLGTWVRLSTSNILRGWGSLFNEPYEASVYNRLIFASYALPIGAYATLLLKQKRRLILSFVLLSLIPIILFSLGPRFIVQLPFSDLIRDIARFSVISSYAYVILIVLLFQELFSKQNIQKKFIGIILFILLFINTLPFWSGELFGASRLEYDIKLRTYNFPLEYEQVEMILHTDKSDTKALYLPIAGELSMLDDKRFNGTYKGIRDIFSGFSPKTGHLGLSDKTKGSSAQLGYYIEQQSNEGSLYALTQILPLINTRYMVVRRNMTHPSYSDVRSGDDMANLLQSNKMLKMDVDGEKISLFSNKTALPHIYIPGQIEITSKPLSSIATLSSQLNYSANPSIFFTQQIPNSNDIAKLLSIQNSQISDKHRPAITYNKINPTKYRIIVHYAKNDFPLVFLESYHHNWKLYSKKITYKNSLIMKNKTISRSIYGIVQNGNLSNENIYETWRDRNIFENNHLVANGYANSWIIEPNQLCDQTLRKQLCKKNLDGSYNFELVLEFAPQKFFHIGAIIAIVSLFIFFMFLLFNSLRLIVHKNR